MRIPGLDAIRALAILLVVAWHWQVLAGDHITRGQFGPLGVTIFFVLSGFLITSLLLREYSGTGTIRLGRLDAATATVSRTEADPNGQLSRTCDQVATITKPASDVAHQVDDALPYIRDCDPSFAGQDCAPNKHLEITHEGEASDARLY